jgi:hypothetical protein
MNHLTLAALYMPAQHAPARGDPEIGAKKGLGHLKRRCSFDSDRKGRDEHPEGGQLARAKSIPAVGAEGPCDAFTHGHTNWHIGPERQIRGAAERLEEGEIVGKTQAPKVTKEGEWKWILTVIEPVSQLLSPGALHVEEG